MQNISVKLNLLMFSLRRKIEILEKIKGITIMQEESKTLSLAESERLFIEKQECIEEIGRLDRGFESISTEIMPVLQANSNRYQDSILQMKEDIKVVTDLSLEIRQLEKKNYSAKRMPTGKANPATGKSYIPKEKILGKYRKQKK